jgi:hypothetical protein
LRGIRYWLDATHFDHLKREKHWQQGTCEWIMEKPEFLDWLNGGSGPFWLCGIPGACPFPIKSRKAPPNLIPRMWQDCHVCFSSGATVLYETPDIPVLL